MLLCQNAHAPRHALPLPSYDCGTLLLDITALSAAAAKQPDEAATYVNEKQNANQRIVERNNAECEEINSFAATSCFLYLLWHLCGGTQWNGCAIIDSFPRSGNIRAATQPPI